MCDKAVDTDPCALKCLPECFMTQEMCDKAVNRCFLYLFLILIDIKLKKCLTEVFLKILFSLRSVPDQYKTQKMCDKGVDDSIGTLKLIPDWFVRSKMIKELVTALYADENILYFDEDSGNVLFSCNEIGILNINLNNTNLDKSDTIIHSRLLAQHIKFEKNVEHLKKS